MLDSTWMAATVSRGDAAARLRVPPTSAALPVPTRELQEMEAGRRRWTLEGAIVGGTLGALIGFLTLQPGGGDDSCARGCGGASGGGFLIGAGVGALLGGLLGSQIRTGS